MPASSGSMTRPRATRHPRDSDRQNHKRNQGAQHEKLGAFLFVGVAMSEHRIQNEGRNALAGKCLNFRANVGSGWTSSSKAERCNRTQTVIVQPGDVVLRQARPFDTGLPAGFADTFGLTPVTITPDMVGQTLGVFHAIEYKDDGGKPSPVQMNFLRAVSANGGRAGVARSAKDALDIALGTLRLKA